MVFSLLKLAMSIIGTNYISQLLINTAEYLRPKCLNKTSAGFRLSQTQSPSLLMFLSNMTYACPIQDLQIIPRNRVQISKCLKIFRANSHRVWNLINLSKLATKSYRVQDFNRRGIISISVNLQNINYNYLYFILFKNHIAMQLK